MGYLRCEDRTGDAIRLDRVGEVLAARGAEGLAGFLDRKNRRYSSARPLTTLPAWSVRGSVRLPRPADATRPTPEGSRQAVLMLGAPSDESSDFPTGDQLGLMLLCVKRANKSLYLTLIVAESVRMSCRSMR